MARKSATGRSNKAGYVTLLVDFLRKTHPAIVLAVTLGLLFAGYAVMAVAAPRVLDFLYEFKLKRLLRSGVCTTGRIRSVTSRRDLDERLDKWATGRKVVPLDVEYRGPAGELYVGSLSVICSWAPAPSSLREGGSLTRRCRRSLPLWAQSAKLVGIGA